jgi:hypothetical protein
MKFFEQVWLIWGKDSIYIYHMQRCVYCIWCGCLCVVHLSCHKGQWPPGWVWTYFMVREGTECLVASSIVSAHRGLPMCTLCSQFCTGFCEINSECLKIHCTYSLPPHTCHYSTHTLITVVSTKWYKILNYHFLDLNLVRNLAVFLLSKSTFWMWLLYRHNSWSW